MKSREQKKVVMLDQPVMQRHHDGGVAGALVWEPYIREQRKERAKRERRGLPPENVLNKRYTKYLPQKPEIGKPLSRGYTVVSDSPAGFRSARDPYNEDTALQALRGWPRLGRSKTQPEMALRPPTDYDPFFRARPNSGSDRSDVSIDSNATNMPDLMSQSYLRNWLAIKREREMAKREEERRQREERKRFFLGKHTRASELRSISVHEKALRTPKSGKDLWQMPKFRNSARPHIETFRLDSRSKTFDQSFSSSQFQNELAAL